MALLQKAIAALAKAREDPLVYDGSDPFPWERLERKWLTFRT